MSKLIPKTILMIRPAQFGFNEEAALSNAFQKQIPHLSPIQIQEIATLEFDNFVRILRSNGIEVFVFDDDDEYYTPDAVFPNNWFSTCIHSQTIYTYPQKLAYRRNERRSDIITRLQKITGFEFDDSLVSYERNGLALEGTGSMVLDHQNKTVYAAISPRTDMVVLDDWCDKTGFSKFAFKARGGDGTLIYHTNVLMTMADTYAVIALDTITERSEREAFLHQMNASNKEIIEISIEQMNQFAGNMLQLMNDQEEKCLIMSSTAYRSLDKDQIELIHRHQNKIIPVPINVIETIGGGSARCMMAEVFIP
ncbi:MAG: hypothetical protein KJP00_16365 [Bacteroidia bacterium]|nr:hypothetical protein [Bacteroidia bacterium]